MSIDSIIIRGIEFGNGKPKICLPIVGTNDAAILEQAQMVASKQPDCVELRIDWYENVFQEEAVVDIIKGVRKAIGNIPLLFTFRSKNEGGEKDITIDQYKDLCRKACQTGSIDLLDVEAYMQEGLLSEIKDMARGYHVYVVGSNHDFDKTPSEQELLNRLNEIDKMGADFPKIAVMPNEERDVLRLLSATLAYGEQGGTKPIITMSMKQMGGISRLSGALTGSVLTFASAGSSSAPGQMPIDQVRQILELL